MMKLLLIGLLSGWALLWGQASGVVLFERPEYGGQTEILNGDVTDMNETWLGPDRVSSLKAPIDVEVILYQYKGFAGRSVILQGQVPDLAEASGWGYRIGSIRLLQRETQPPVFEGGQGIVLFSQPDFQGDYSECFDSVANLANHVFGNDRVASVWVQPGYSVTLYEDKNYHGRYITLEEGIHDLDDTPLGRGQVSSLRVFHDQWPPADPPAVAVIVPTVAVDIALANDDLGDVLGVAAGLVLLGFAAKAIHDRYKPEPGPGVILYDGAGFKGRSQVIRRDYRNLKRTGLGNDRVSSIDIPPGYEVVLFQDTRFRGRSIVLREGLTDLAETPLGDNTASSMRIRWTGR